MGGGDKCLRELGGRTLLARVIERAAPQVERLVLNANGDPERFSSFDLPVEADHVSGFAGPLAGILTGMEWAREHAPGCDWLVSFATDTPLFPTDLVARLQEVQRREAADIVCAASGGRDHPVFALWPIRLAAALRAAMLEEDIRKVDVFTARYRLARASWDSVPFDPFFNANRPDDWARAEALLTMEAGQPG